MAHTTARKNIPWSKPIIQVKVKVMFAKLYEKRGIHQLYTCGEKLSCDQARRHL